MLKIHDTSLFEYSGSEALEIFGQLAAKESIARNLNANIHFSKRISMGSGVTFDGKIPIQIFVGIQNLCNQDKVSDIDLLESFRVLYHELRHADHKLYKFETCDECVSNMRIDYMACDKNSCFYGFRKNSFPADDYWHNIREIDCEMYAFGRMHQLLQNKELFPYIEDADAVMVEYTNNRLFLKNVAEIPFCVSDSYLKPDEPFKSVSEIQDCYRETIQKCALRGNKNYRVSIDPGSELSCVLGSSRKWSTVRTWMARQKDGSIRTKTAASIMLKLHPEYKDNLGVTSDEEEMLDFKSLFGTEQPHISRSTIHNVNQQVLARQKREDELLNYYSKDDDEFEV